MELKTADKGDLKDIKCLYRSAFPSNERKPLFVMNRARKKGRCEFLIIKDCGKFSGIMITVPTESAVLLDYFAVDEKARNKGIGTNALALLKEYYPGKSIVLEAELPSENDPEDSIKRRRVAFYKRCGFKEASYRVTNVAGEMHILYNGSEVPYETVYESNVLNAGRFLTKYVAKIRKSKTQDK